MSMYVQIDRLYNWKTTPNSDVQNTLKKQARNTKDEFDERAKETIIQFAEQVRTKCFFNAFMPGDLLDKCRLDLRYF